MRAAASYGVIDGFERAHVTHEEEVTRGAGGVDGSAGRAMKRGDMRYCLVVGTYRKQSIDVGVALRDVYYSRRVRHRFGARAASFALLGHLRLLDAVAFRLHGGGGGGGGTALVAVIG